MRKQFADLHPEQRAMAVTGMVRISAAWSKADIDKQLRLLECQTRLTAWIAGMPFTHPIRARRKAKGEYVSV